MLSPTRHVLSPPSITASSSSSPASLVPSPSDSMLTSQIHTPAPGFYFSPELEQTRSAHPHPVGALEGLVTTPVLPSVTVSILDEPNPRLASPALAAVPPDSSSDSFSLPSMLVVQPASSPASSAESDSYWVSPLLPTTTSALDDTIISADDSELLALPSPPDSETMAEESPVTRNEGPSLQKGRTRVRVEEGSDLACSDIVFDEEFGSDNVLMVMATIERESTAIKASAKPIINVKGVTAHGLALCLGSIVGNFSEDEMMTVNWLVLQKEEPWIRTGAFLFASDLLFLDGVCELKTDYRKTDSRGNMEAVVVPALGSGHPRQYPQFFRQGLVRWIEKLDVGRFSYCMQRVLDSEASGAHRTTKETYFLVSANDNANVVSTTGFVTIPPWSPALNCRRVELRSKTTAPILFTSLEHPITLGNAYSSDAAITWVSNVSVGGFTICLEEIRDFWRDGNAFRSEATVHWIALYS